MRRRWSKRATTANQRHIALARVKLFFYGPRILAAGEGGRVPLTTRSRKKPRCFSCHGDERGRVNRYGKEGLWPLRTSRRGTNTTCLDISRRWRCQLSRWRTCSAAVLRRWWRSISRRLRVPGVRICKMTGWNTATTGRHLYVLALWERQTISRDQFIERAGKRAIVGFCERALHCFAHDERVCAGALAISGGFPESLRVLGERDQPDDGNRRLGVEETRNSRGSGFGHVKQY